MHSRHALRVPGAVPGSGRSGGTGRRALRGDRDVRAVRAEGHPLPDRATPASRARSRARRTGARSSRGFGGPRDVAGEHGIALGIEPLHREIYGSWSIVTSIPQAIDLMDEIDQPERPAAVRRLPPVGHAGRARAHPCGTAPRVAPSVHICDWRDPTAERLRPRAARRRDHRPARGSSARSRPAAGTAGSTSRSSPTTARSPTRTSRTRSGSRTRSTSSGGPGRASSGPGTRRKAPA